MYIVCTHTYTHTDNSTYFKVPGPQRILEGQPWDPLQGRARKSGVHSSYYLQRPWTGQRGVAQ